MIDRRELSSIARQRKLTLIIVEKDYVLGWVLFGLSTIPDIVLKGDTALSKVYFSQNWRFSEDLDFSTDRSDWTALSGQIDSALTPTSGTSGIHFVRKSVHSNPRYLQLRIQYDAILQRNTLKIDITNEPTIGHVEKCAIPKSYSDYPDYVMSVQGREEILAEKLRALIQRTKARDYYDAWRILEQGVDETRARNLFLRKIQFSQLRWTDIDDFFPKDLEPKLLLYWEDALGRLVQPVPDMHSVLTELRNRLHWLK